MHLILSNYSIWGFCVMVLCSWLQLAECYFNCTLPVFYYFVSYKKEVIIIIKIIVVIIIIIGV